MPDIYKSPLGRNQSRSPGKKTGSPKETPKKPVPKRRIIAAPHGRPHYWCKRQQGPHLEPPGSHPVPALGCPAVSCTEKKPHKAAHGKKQAWVGTPPLSAVFGPGPY